MRRALFAVPPLLCLMGCQALDPTMAYREAAQKLNFTLDRVEPSLDLGFPLDRTRLGLRLTLGVDNPTEVAFKARSIEGRIYLDEGGTSHAVGQLSSDRGLDLPAHGRTPVSIDLSFAYGEVREALGSLESVVLRGRSGTWRLDGQMKLDVLGFPITVPLRPRKHMGAP